MGFVHRTLFCAVSLVARTARGRAAIRAAGWESARDPITSIFLPQDPTILFQVQQECLLHIILLFREKRYKPLEKSLGNRHAYEMTKLQCLYFRKAKIPQSCTINAIFKLSFFSRIATVGITSDIKGASPGQRMLQVFQHRPFILLSTLLPAGTMDV